MLNHFSNAAIKDKGRLNFMNDYLSDKYGWEIDDGFVKYIEDNGPSYIPPIFRYGSNAGMNWGLRTDMPKEGKEEFEAKYSATFSLPTMENLSKNVTTNGDGFFKYLFSSKEIDALRGVDGGVSETDLIPISTGATVFKLTRFVEALENLNEYDKEAMMRENRI